jgi:hypothetical protein
VFDKERITRIAKAAGQGPRDAQALIDLTQEQQYDGFRSDDPFGELSLALYTRFRVRTSNDWNSPGSGTICFCF